MKMNRADVIADRERHAKRRADRRQRKRDRIKNAAVNAKGEVVVCRTNMEDMYEHWITFHEYVTELTKLWNLVPSDAESFYDKETDITWVGQKRDIVLQGAGQRILSRLDDESEVYDDFTTLPEEDNDDGE